MPFTDHPLSNPHADGATSEAEPEEPEFLDDLDIRIDAEGVWHWDGAPVRRHDMVCMLAYMLDRDADGAYWLRSPTEYGRITVDDVPFLVVAVFAGGEGRDQIVTLETNVERLVTLDKDHPLRIETDPETGRPRPYVTVGGTMEARIERAAYYDLVTLGTEEEIDGHRLFGIWSSGHFFVLGPVP